MDMHMPEMDGIEATRRIRSNANLQTLPIIAMTASAMMEDRDLMLKAGMNDYISKPVAFATLSATVAKWTHRGTPAAVAQPPAN
jgi:two-component system, sensor histidine kinase and response regulator